MWLVFLGNIVVWTTVQLKNSQLPEVAANHMIKLGGWMHSSCSEHGVYEKALRAGRVSVTWLSAVDREAAFSQRLLCSAAAILGTVARVVENAAAAGQS
ncbi:hypothetical protein LPJ61_006724 [Coemansia biformis]|uniref:Uncharacterized protein n=1 Tax=Coemansia biformis TaxID=1286918 RepID=A0A9W7XTN5_9FUNG|nr:hypothetical protein LPJ61_006724 [Coemansia biformis]